LVRSWLSFLSLAQFESRLPMDVESNEQYSSLAKTIGIALERAIATGQEQEVQAAITQALEAATSEGADRVIESLKRDAPKMLAEQEKIRDGFETRLRKRWGKALDLFEMTLVSTQEAGNNFCAQHADKAARENDIMFWALVRLHARACQVASEVLALLRGGYAIAAMARWRTIHEIAVTTTLIREHGADLAKRYLEHEVIESAAAVRDYQLYYTRLGYEPYDDGTVAELAERRKVLLDRYGRDFDATYGWAGHAIGTACPNFRRLEQAAKLDHMRPHYRMASHGIHSNPKGILFHLDSIGRESVLHAGASNSGLADPGHATLITLNLCTMLLLTMASNEDTLLILKVLTRLEREAGEQFLSAHNALVKKELRLQRRQK
ncbi:MAG: DUF5677 domain-containing protein, partial [Ktedonobacterales bacterium]